MKIEESEDGILKSESTSSFLICILLVCDANVMASEAFI